MRKVVSLSGAFGTYEMFLSRPLVPAHSAIERNVMSLSSESGTCRTVKARFWPWRGPLFGWKSLQLFELVPPRAPAVFLYISIHLYIFIYQAGFYVRTHGPPPHITFATISSHTHRFTRFVTARAPFKIFALLFCEECPSNTFRGPAFEPRGDDSKRCKDFYLNAKARIWP